jgi:hypothetical protein
LAVLVVVLIVYKKMKYRCKWKMDQIDKSLVGWRSPHFVKFMESIKLHKSHYFTITE